MGLILDPGYVQHGLPDQSAAYTKAEGRSKSARSTVRTNLDRRCGPGTDLFGALSQANRMKNGPFQFSIGRGSWIQEIRYYTTQLNPQYWARFGPLKSAEISLIEKEVGRRLPEDFKEFLRVFGCGRFPSAFGGDIYNPAEFVHGCHGHLYMMLGSNAWASDDEQRQFYVTHGAYNPAPARYSHEALDFEGVDLLDLLQIGTNGLAYYHQIYVGDQPCAMGYCMLTPERTMEDAAPSFSEGLKMMLTHHWFWEKASGEEDLEPSDS